VIQGWSIACMVFDHHYGDGPVHISPINNEDLHSYIDTTNTCDGILTMMSYELMQKKRLSRLWSIVPSP